MSPNPCFRVCRCGEPCLVDADWCGPCEIVERDRVRLAVNALRAKRSKAGLCADCGRKVSKEEAASDRQVKLCPAHEVRRTRLRNRGVTRVVTNVRERIKAATSVSSLSSEEGRSRYHGLGEKGKPTTTVTNAAAFVLIRKELTVAERSLELAWAPEAGDLPRIQRDDLRAEARAKLGLTAREIVVMYLRLGGEFEELRPAGDE